MKIVFFEVSPEDQGVLAGMVSRVPEFSGAQITYNEQPLSAATASLAADAEAVSIFIRSQMTPDIFALLPNLKVLVTCSTGYDHINLDAAKQHGVIVCNVPGYGSRTVAEYAFALILALSRKIFPAVRRIKESGDFSIANLEGFDLFGKTLGVIGTGKIGLNAARIGKGFGMEVVAADAFPNQQAASEIGFSYASLEEVLAKSDVITIHVPYLPSTHHLINSENIVKMKPGSLLVNTARGEVVETEALIEALDKKILAGAGLDVIEGERNVHDEWELLANHSESAAANMEDAQAYKVLLEEHALVNRPEVIITPHIAFYSKEAKAEILKTCAENLAAFAGGAPKNIVK